MAYVRFLRDASMHLHLRHSSPDLQGQLKDALSVQGGESACPLQDSKGHATRGTFRKRRQEDDISSHHLGLITCLVPLEVSATIQVSEGP